MPHEGFIYDADEAALLLGNVIWIGGGSELTLSGLSSFSNFLRGYCGLGGLVMVA